MRSLNRLGASLRACLALAIALALFGCDRSLSTEASRDDPFAGEPFISGTIMTISLDSTGWGKMLVENEAYRGECDGTRADVTVSSHAELRRASGAPATVADLVVGREVKVWAIASILLSCPPGVTAGAILIEGAP